MQTVTFSNYNLYVGETSVVAGALVQRVNCFSNADIDLCRYTDDCSQIAKRKYKVQATGIRYASLDSAVKAVLKLRNAE